MNLINYFYRIFILSVLTFIIAVPFTIFLFLPAISEYKEYNMTDKKIVVGKSSSLYLCNRLDSFVNMPKNLNKVKCSSKRPKKNNLILNGKYKPLSNSIYLYNVDKVKNINQLRQLIETAYHEKKHYLQDKNNINMVGLYEIQKIFNGYWDNKFEKEAREYANNKMNDISDTEIKNNFSLILQ